MSTAESLQKCVALAAKSIQNCRGIAAKSLLNCRGIAGESQGKCVTADCFGIAAKFLRTDSVIHHCNQTLCEGKEGEAQV